MDRRRVADWTGDIDGWGWVEVEAAPGAVGGGGAMVDILDRANVAGGMAEGKDDDGGQG